MADLQERPCVLDGDSLTVEELVRVARNPRVRVEVAAGARARVDRCAALIEDLVERYKNAYEAFENGRSEARPISDYGVTTGFGKFKDIPIHPDDLRELSKKILLGHATGVGDSSHPDDLANYFSAEVVRAVLVIRLNCFLKGNSGIRFVLVEAIRRMINRGIVPLVPLHGSVGASGDLCPLSHLFATLLGEGRYYRVRTAEDLAPGRRRDLEPASVMERDLGAAGEEYSLPAERVSFKEGLALTNGANFSAAMLALAIHDAEILANTADVGLALDLEALCGCARAFDDKIHLARNLEGQRQSAANVRRLLEDGSRRSLLLESRDEVQDPYSLRCAPAVHGATRDAIAYAKMVAEAEINAATDNPLFFPHPDPAAEHSDHSALPWDLEFRDNWEEREGGKYEGERRASYSAANFHGQPVGQAADFLAMAVAELADISERRTQALLDGHHSRGLPGNLVPMRGLNSGLMVAQYAAASLVSENKILAHPATVDSIPTSANAEDHVSMATAAGRKLLRVLRNSQATIAIELLAATQAIAWRALVRTDGYREMTPVPQDRLALELTEDQWGSLGGHVTMTRPERNEYARNLDRREEALFSELTDDAIARLLASGTEAAFRSIRRAGVAAIREDQLLDEPIRKIRRLVENGTLVADVNRALKEARQEPLAPIPPLGWRRPAAPGGSTS